MRQQSARQRCCGRGKMFEREIDPDEGYRPGEPFFTESLPCEFCGLPAPTRKPMGSELLIGECCELGPVEPVCPELLEVIDSCPLVSSVAVAMEGHRSCCGVCKA